MGTSTISRVGEVFAPGQLPVGSAGSTKEELKVAFAELMGQMSTMVGDGMPNQKGNSQPEFNLTVDVARGSDRAYDWQSYRETGVRESGSRQVVKDDRIAEKLEDYAGNARDVLKEKLGASDEQIEEAMEKLGLGFADLMDPTQLASLVAELSGTQDMATLLCSSDFVDVMQAFDELGENLLAELGITAEELGEMLKAAVNGMPADNDLQAAENPIAADTLQTSKSVGTDQEAVETPANVMQETETGVTAVEKNPEKTSYEDGHALAAEENASANIGPADEKEKTLFSGGEDLHQQNAQTGNGEHVLLGQMPEEAQTVQSTETAEYTPAVDTADIIRQIVEFSRVTVGNAATTMEMQLNPEHLGKVFLELTSKNGVVSAHLTAQNEAAKAALESQMVDLRQNLTQAGVKVEAVEVTVGSHEFERNLEQNAKHDEQQAEQQEKMAKQTRRISMDDLDELVGVMSEEERLVAQMMAEQGNSIDYTA